jgi:uncharacterized repeat protein (TIGR01451 family)
MRSLYIFAGIIALGIGLAGWAALGKAGPGDDLPPPPPTDPIPGGLPPTVSNPNIRPLPKPKPADDLFDVPSPPMPPTSTKPIPSTNPPVRVLDQIDVPDPPKSPPTKSTPSRTDVKPTVFIPNPDAVAEAPKVVPAMATGALSHQEAGISLEWQGPATLQVNSPVEYTLVARNTSASPLQKVTVQVRLPAGAKLLGAEPKCDGTDGILVWEHGTMTSRQEKAVKITLVPPGKGELQCQAWVTFTGSAIMKAQVREAKLAMAAKAPEKVAIGDLATVVFHVSNTGDHAAEGVKLAVSLGAGLECERGPKVVLDLNTIAAGDTKEVKIPCVARGAGPQQCEATAQGANGLSATTSALVTVVQPKLDVQVAGPKLRYLDRKAAYVLTVTNSGDASATRLVVTHQIPPGFKYVSASDGGKHSAVAGTITWEIGDIPAGQMKDLKCELLAAGIGDLVHKIGVSGDRGAHAETSIATKVEGLSAMAMEVTDSDDPVEVGSDTTYEIRVANTGSKDETDIKLVCTIPTQMKFKSARGPGKYEMVGGEVIFEVLPKLAAKTEAIFKVTVTAAQKGDARFKATLTAGDLTEPVVKQESTRVYSD